MNLLVSVDAAKRNWRVDHASDDDLIESIVRSASELVLSYLNLTFDNYDDSNGEIPTSDDDGEPDVPHAIRAAVLMLGGILYRDPSGKESANWQPGFLPAPVTALLYNLRDPALA